MSNPSIYSLPSKSTKDAIIQKGDAVLVIRRDGEIVPFTVGIDEDIVARMRTKSPEDMTEEELDMALQGQTLFLLTMVAKSELLMDLMRKVASEPGEPSIKTVSAALTMH